MSRTILAIAFLRHLPCHGRGGERAKGIEDEEAGRIEIDFDRLPDREVVDAMRQRHPPLACEVDMDEAFRPGDLRNRDGRADADRVRRRPREVEMVRAKSDRVGAVGESCERPGRRQLQQETREWNRMADIIGGILDTSREEL